MPEIDLLTIMRGHVSAPAGYGKTQLIADSLKGHEENKPVLILTHTNAGVAALRKRLAKNGVSSRASVLQTLDGWALRLINTYPKRSGIDPQRLAIANPKQDYPAIQTAARDLVAGGDIDTILQGSYSRLWVDEYQDCSTVQHEMVLACADLLSTVVLGDPMQSVFDFAGTRVDWDELPTNFPEHHELDIPLRWENADAPQIGQWLAHVRQALIDRAPIDLNDLPDGVVWRRPAPPQQQNRSQAFELRELARAGSVLIIGPSMNERARHNFARNTPGVTVVEPVELSRLMAFARNLNLDEPFYAVEECVGLARDVMTGLSQAGRFRRRIERIYRKGSGRLNLTDADHAALYLIASPSYTAVTNLLQALRETSQSRLFRPTVYNATLCTLSRASTDQFESLPAAARAERDVRRHQERTAGKMAIGSTLLLKGLEADSCMIMKAHTLSRNGLYVALTRGAKRICIWSECATLQPC